MSNKPLILCLCLRCNYQWQSAIPEGPSACPSCKSPFWDVPRLSQGNQLHEH